MILRHGPGVPRCGGSTGPIQGSSPCLQGCQSSPPATTPVAAQTVSERAVDVASRYLSSDNHVWGGQACIDAHLGVNGIVYGYSGGQCRQFLNCIIYMASSGRFNPGGANYSFPNATVVDRSQARRGDLIQVGQGIHTALISSVLPNGTFMVIDSNYVAHEKVGQHAYNPPAGAVFSRYTQTA